MLLALNILNLSANLLTVALVAVLILLILVVMMQRPKQEGLGAAFGGGLTDAAWGAKTTDVLQTATKWLGFCLFFFVLTLNIINGFRLKGMAVEKPAAATTLAPALPTDPQVTQDLTKALEKVEQKAGDTAPATSENKDAPATTPALESKDAPSTPATPETPAPAEAVKPAETPAATPEPTPAPEVKSEPAPVPATPAQ